MSYRYDCFSHAAISRNSDFILQLWLHISQLAFLYFTVMIYLKLNISFLAIATLCLTIVTWYLTFLTFATFSCNGDCNWTSYLKLGFSHFTVMTLYISITTSYLKLAISITFWLYFSKLLNFSQCDCQSISYNKLFLNIKFYYVFESGFHNLIIFYNLQKSAARSRMIKAILFF